MARVPVLLWGAAQLLCLPVAIAGEDAARPVEAQLREKGIGPFQTPADQPGLPRVLLIGDSISIGYTEPVRKLLAGKAAVHRPAVNCQHTAYGLKHLKGWLGKGDWDVIHFNFGIWDTHYLLKSDGALVRGGQEGTLPPETIRLRHDLEEYRRNLTSLATTLKGTGAKVIWASSTPIMYRQGERFQHLVQYNGVAAEVMKEQGIPINDLYNVVLPEAKALQSGDQCHFNAKGNQRLAEEVSRHIAEALPAKP